MTDSLKSILVVDDNLDLCRPLVALIRHMGYQSQYATDGPSALNTISLAVPDLVILDVMMPGMDGMEVLRRLKANAATKSVPVVMFTAVADAESRAMAVNQGAVDYWVKASMEFEDMKDRITKLLSPKAKSA